MTETGTTQSRLAQMSGIRQPSISQFLSGKVGLSDEQLDRLLSCMGYQLEVARRPVAPDLTHSERRSWMLHRRLSSHLTQATFDSWLPTIERNLERNHRGVRGSVHLDNLRRWRALIESRDLAGLKRAMTGLDRQSIEMREVTPFGGLLPEDERREILHDLSVA